jgi:hypothetical protein
LRTFVLIVRLGACARFLRFDRPVLVYDGDDTDNSEKFYVAKQGFFNDFSYLSDAAYDRAIVESQREPPA